MRLYEEVISEYGDLPHLTRHRRELEALLKEPTPEWNGKPLTPEGRRNIETILARKKTLGQEAEAGLDEMLNLAVGRPAPEIKGADVDGKRLKLSDYQGKVVVLVFWGSWCGPCMGQVLHERELVERLKGQPFALLGVDCEPDKDTAQNHGAGANDLAELVRRRPGYRTDRRTLSCPGLSVGLCPRCKGRHTQP